MSKSKAERESKKVNGTKAVENAQVNGGGGNSTVLEKKVKEGKVVSEKPKEEALKADAVFLNLRTLTETQTPDSDSASHQILH